MQFKGSKEYVSTDDLSIAVNAAINLEKPLLVKGEPGTMNAGENRKVEYDKTMSNDIDNDKISKKINTII